MALMIGGTAQIPVYETNTTTTAKTISNLTSLNAGDIFEVENGNYYFYSGGSTSFVSNNNGEDNTTAYTKFTAKHDISSFYISYYWSSEENYDIFSIEVAGLTIAEKSGGYDQSTNEGYGYDSYTGGALSKGSSIIFRYKKDSSNSYGEDYGEFYISNIKYTEVITTETLVGTETRENVALKVKNIWIGDSNGVARLVKQAWIGDANGIARTLFIGETEKIFTSSGTFTVPAGITSVDIFCVGGGGGGGGSYFYEYWYSSGAFRGRTYFGAPGAGGYTQTLLNHPVKEGDTFTITVGAGGTAGLCYAYSKDAEAGTTDNWGSASSTSNISNGGAGGTTSVLYNGTSLLSVKGGNGGSKTATTSSNTPSYVNGANGGTGSNVSWSEYVYEDSSQNETATYYCPDNYQKHDGANGEQTRKYTWKNNAETPGSYYGTPGTGQGRTTREWGVLTETLYSSSGNSVGGGSFSTPKIPANSGYGGHPGMSSAYNGAAGIVIIRYGA